MRSDEELKQDWVDLIEFNESHREKPASFPLLALGLAVVVLGAIWLMVYWGWFS